MTIGNRRFPGRFFGALGGVLVLFPAVLSAGAAHVINVQEVSSYTPLEIKLGYYDSAPGTRAGMAALYNNGSNNIIDIYDLSLGSDGVTVNNSFLDAGMGQVFGLGDICVLGDHFVMPFIRDFNLYAMRWDGTSVTGEIIDDSTDRYTAADCFETDGVATVGAFNFDTGDLDYYQSPDQGLSWDLSASYSLSDDEIIGGFGGGFIPVSGAFNFAGNAYGGSVYQRASGDLEAVALDPATGDVFGTTTFDDLGGHADFIGNGSLKECDGFFRALLTYAFGACNGGSAIGFSWINPNAGTPDSRILNSVTGNELDFQSVALQYSSVAAPYFSVHILSNRHVRLRINGDTGEHTFEEIPGYSFADIGGPVDAVFGADRMFVAAAGFASDSSNPGLVVATMDPDPTVMLGEPLGDAPPPDGSSGDGTASIPVLQRHGLLVLIMVILGVTLVHMRVRGGS